MFAISRRHSLLAVFIAAFCALALRGAAAAGTGCDAGYRSITPVARAVGRHRQDILDAVQSAKLSDFSKKRSALVLDRFEELLQDAKVVDYTRLWLEDEGAEGVVIPTTPENLKLLGWKVVDPNATDNLVYCPACLFKSRAGAFALDRDIYVSHQIAANLDEDPTLLHESKHGELNLDEHLKRNVNLGADFSALDDKPMYDARTSKYSSYLSSSELVTYGQQQRNNFQALLAKKAFANDFPASIKQVRKLALKSRKVIGHLEELSSRFLVQLEGKSRWSFRRRISSYEGDRNTDHDAIFTIGNVELRVPLSRYEIGLYQNGRRTQLQRRLVEKIRKIQSASKRLNADLDIVLAATKSDAAEGKINQLPAALDRTYQDAQSAQFGRDLNINNGDEER